jgi:hypothetical protein
MMARIARRFANEARELVLAHAFRRFDDQVLRVTRIYPS